MIPNKHFYFLSHSADNVTCRVQVTKSVIFTNEMQLDVLPLQRHGVSTTKRELVAIHILRRAEKITI